MARALPPPFDPTELLVSPPPEAPASATKRKGGRPPKWTQAVQDRICFALRHGAYIETAARFGGICKDTLYDWLKQAANGEEPYVSFSDAVEKAGAESELMDLWTVSVAALKGQWQAAAWRRERRNPERWGRFDRMELRGNKEHPLGVVALREMLSAVPDDDLSPSPGGEASDPAPQAGDPGPG